MPKAIKLVIVEMDPCDWINSLTISLNPYPWSQYANFLIFFNCLILGFHPYKIYNSDNDDHPSGNYSVFSHIPSIPPVSSSQEMTFPNPDSCQPLNQKLYILQLILSLQQLYNSGIIIICIFKMSKISYMRFKA